MKQPKFPHQVDTNAPFTVPCSNLGWEASWVGGFVSGKEEKK